MSEAFVDVSWRGLEVGKRVKLHAAHATQRADASGDDDRGREAAEAYLDHGTPMPVGTLLSIRTDEGLEIAATVVRVHEQVGGSTEVPGMQVVPRGLAGEAQAWWTARVEAAAAAAPAPAAAAAPAPVAAPAPAPAPAPASAAAPAAAAASAPAPAAAPVAASASVIVQAPPMVITAEPPPADPRADITSRPTLTMSAVEMERAIAAAAAGNTDASRTEVMTAVADPEAPVDGVVVTNAPDDPLEDDGRRTTVMSAADISAIVEAAETETSGPVGGDDDGPSTDGPSGDGNAATAPTGKRKRSGGRRSKKR